MSVPLHSFERIPTTEASAGDLVYITDGWFLRLENEDGDHTRGLILTGPNAGKVVRWPTANGIRISHGNSWQVLAKVGAPVTGSFPAVSVGEEGVTFHGYQWNIPELHYAFTPFGQEIHARREPWEYISSFSVWLNADDGTPLGVNPVFTVGA
ncbi:hypothetical protein [Stenotrophomonas maltophilia]|nr:hypothetical protein [Stenotrophomonas maltophilia]